MKISKLLMLGVVVVAVFAVQSMADTFTIVSDETMPIVGIYDKSDNLQPAMTPVSDTNAVRAWEPRNSTSFWLGPYIDPTDDVTKSLWDTQFPLAAYTYLQSVGADWIWDTAHAEGSAAPGTAPFGSDPSLVGHVVVFEKTFNIDGNPTAGSLLIEADNCWQVYINDVNVGHAKTCVAGWETSDLHGAFVKGDGWASDSLTIDVSSFLTSGENTITILVGNEYHGWNTYGVPASGADEGDLPVPAWNQVPYVGNSTYYQYNPGALIFALEVTYEEIIPCIDVEKLVSVDGGENYFDADAPTGPTAMEGDQVLWIYEVNNCGDVNLTDIDLTDDNGTPSDLLDDFSPVYISGDDNLNNILDVGEVWIYGAESTAIAGQFENIAYVSGWFEDTEVTDDDPANYFGEEEEQEGFCTLTQGAYGTSGGAPSPELFAELMSDGPVIVGLPGRSITFDTVQCIIDRLPAGGTAAVLPAGNFTCESLPNSLVKRNKPEINNVLVGQVVALTLNTRLDDDLGYFVLPGTEDEDGAFCTVSGDECPIQNIIKKEVIAILGEGANVYDLLDAANAALGTPGTSKDVLAALNDAISTINEAFDECANLVECTTEEICGNGCDDDFDGLVDEGCIS